MVRKRRYTKKSNYWSKRKRKPQAYRALWEPDFSLDPEIAKEVLAIIILIVVVFSLFSILKIGGSLGQLWYSILRLAFGWTTIFLTLTLGFLGYGLLSGKYQIKASNILGIFLFILSLSGIFHLFYSSDLALKLAKTGKGGGFLGYYLASFLKPLLSVWASLILLLGILTISILITFNLSIKKLKERLAPKIGEKKPLLAKIPPLRFPLKIHEIEKKPPLEGEEKLEASGKILPPIDLLDAMISEPSAGDVRKNAQIIKETLAHFGIPVEMAEVNVGPTVSQYTLKPQEGIKLNKITALANDLALALAAHPIRIEAPIPGKALVGIEVPNKVRALVRLREILEDEIFKNARVPLVFALGKDVGGHPEISNLAKMPHLLIAGATGTGKSICINSIILSLLYKNTPQDLKLILIDPKRVELPAYNGIPHLLTPVVTDHTKAISALKWAVSEMDRRYKIFEETQKKDIATYNRAFPSSKMPYLTIAIDELADLMILAPSEVEEAVIRLAQLARATGIHLVIATQRPSVDVITGLIKANITYRIAFATASQVDSRTILDMAGSEKLLGEGDMLYLSGEVSKPKRLQGTYVSEREIKEVVNFLKKEGAPQYEEEILKMPVKTSKGWTELPEDDLYKEAAELVIRAGRASASLLQRRLKVGYARAARLLDILEEKGLVSPPEDSKPRQVLINSLEEWEELEKAQSENEEE